MDIGSWEFWRAQAMATDDFFRARLDSMIDLHHPLVVLATRMPWAAIEASLAPLLAHKDRSGRVVEDADLFGPTSQLAGAGPVGLMAAASAKFAGAERIWMIDHHDYRLEFARRTYGVETINFDRDDDPAAILIDATQGRGVDAVGFEAKGSTTEAVLAAMKLEGGSGKALRQCIAAVRRGGIVSVPGVYTGPSTASCSATPSTRG